MFKKILLLALVFIGTNQNSNSQSLYFPPVSNAANWETVSPDSLGWCVQNLDSLFGFLEQQNSKAFMVLKDGKIAIEKYG